MIRTKYKILHILGFYPEIGGPVMFVGNLIKSLSNKGINHKILSPLPPNYDNTKLNNIQKEFNVFYYKTEYLSNLFPSYSSCFPNSLIRHLQNVDIIHLHGVFNYYSYWVCKKVTDKPIILSPHGSIIRWGIRKDILNLLKKGIYLKIIGKMIFERAHIIHLTTEYELKEFCSIVGNKYNNKIVIIPIGVKAIDTCKISRELFYRTFKIPLDRKIILFLGRITRKKGLDILIPAFARLSQEYEEFLLIIAGPDEMGYKKDIENIVKKYRIEDRVLFTGYIDGDLKYSAYKASELFVLPSYTENFGIATVEAMALELPVVISKETGISEEVKKNNAGLVINADSESLYQGMKALLDNPTLRKNIATNGRKLVEEYYDIDKVAERMISVYEEAINEAYRI